MFSFEILKSNISGIKNKITSFDIHRTKLYLKENQTNFLFVEKHLCTS